MTPLAELEDMVPRMNELAAANGRAKPRLVVSGHLDARSFEVYQALDVESVSFRVPSSGFDDVRRAMDEAAATIDAVGGQLG